MLARLLVVAGIVVSALVLRFVLRRVMTRLVGRTGMSAEIWRLAERCQGPFVLVVFLLLLRTYQGVLESTIEVNGWFGPLLNVVVLLSVGWLATRITAVLIALATARFGRTTVDDPQRLQRIRTQMRVFETVASVLIWLTTLIVIMLTFPATRPIATSLFASASLLSLVIGIAAQNTLASMMAGLQIAFGDVVRIDDMVVVDGKRGVVEELALTYVVIRMLDYRRVVVPVTYFVNMPFENWTRKHPGVRTDTYLNVDFAAPVPKIRDEVRRIIESSPLWDQGEYALVVAEPETRHAGMRLQISFGAPTPSMAADLTAQLREHLIDYLVREAPESLPRTRTTAVPMTSRA